MRYLVLAQAFPVEDWACSAAAAGKLQDREPCAAAAAGSRTTNRIPMQELTHWIIVEKSKGAGRENRLIHK
jgi:hypothetical protein